MDGVKLCLALPAPDDGVDIGRIELQPVAPPPEPRNGSRIRSPLAVQSLMASMIKATGFGVGCRASRFPSDSERENVFAPG